MKEYFDTNKKYWDQVVDIHKDSKMYDLANFKKGKSSLNEIELAALANEVAGKSLLHLQCHFGQDTLSWARLGAQVTGIDLSPKSIALARQLSEELEIDARFIESNIYDLPKNLEGEFDFIFTSYGTYTWLPDLKPWAKIINKFLKPGGTFYMADFHPTLYLFEFTKGTLEFHYFNQKKPYEEVSPGTYTDFDADVSAKEYFWTHSLHEVMSPLLAEGLQLKEFQEFPYSPYNSFENMEDLGGGRYRYNVPSNISLPHVFSLKMQKPG